MARSDAGQLKSDAGGSERLQDSAGAAFTQLLCQQLASKMAAWDHTPHAIDAQQLRRSFPPRRTATAYTGRRSKHAIDG